MDIKPQEELHRIDGGRRVIPIITVVTLLAAAALLAAISSVSPLSVSGVLFTSAAAAAAAFVCCSVGSRYPLTITAAAYLFALLFFRKPVEAVSACAFFPCALMMTEAQKRSHTRTKALFAISAALGAGCVIYIALVLALNYGGLSTVAFRTAYDSFMVVIREGFTAYGLTEDIITTLIGYMLVLSPSMIICLLLFTAYLTTAFYITLCRLFRLEERLLPSFPWQIEMSIMSACVFIASYAVTMLFTAGNATPLSLTADNIIIILTPGFALIGVKRAVSRVKTRSGGFVTAIVGVIAFLLLFINITAFFISVSFLGVIETVMDSVKIRMSGIK